MSKKNEDVRVVQAKERLAEKIGVVARFDAQIKALENRKNTELERLEARANAEIVRLENHAKLERDSA